MFVLRLFNDCFAAAGLWAAVACWQRRWWGVGAVVFSLGVGVKMSVLLAAPAVGVVLWLGAGREAAVRAGVVMGAVQVCFSLVILVRRREKIELMIFAFCSAGPARLRVLGRQPEGLPKPCFRAEPRVHVQVDGQLAFRWGRSLPFARLLARTARPPCRAAARLLALSLAEAGRHLAVRRETHAPATAVEARTGTHFTSRDARICHDHGADCDDDRLPVREESALPVLRLHCLVDAVSAVAGGAASSGRVCDLGGAGGGLERVSEHRSELHGRCGMPCRDCCGGLAGVDECDGHCRQKGKGQP